MAGTASYSGNVLIRQGTFRNSCFQYWRNAPGNEIKSIIADGSPVSFNEKWITGEQQPDELNMKYFVADKRLTLTGNAELTEDKDRFASNWLNTYRKRTITRRRQAAARASHVRRQWTRIGCFYPTNKAQWIPYAPLTSEKSYKKTSDSQRRGYWCQWCRSCRLTGPNGAGKPLASIWSSRFSRRRCRQGVIKWTMSPPCQCMERCRHGIGCSRKKPVLFRRKLTSQNIMAVLELRKAKQTETTSPLRKFLEEFQLSHLLSSPRYSSLSGGEHRRAEIARALASEPKFILLEWTLCRRWPISVLEIRKIVKHLVQRNLGIITDHSVRETRGVRTRAYILSKRKNIIEGSPEYILNNWAG